MANNAITTSSSLNTPKPPSPTETRHILSNLTPSQSNSEAGTEFAQLQSEIEKLKGVLSQTSTKVAQKILREKWREFIFAYNDEDHISFLLRAILKNVEATTLSKVFRDESLYKSRMFDFMSVKEQMIVRVLQSVNYDQLISLVPEAVLNKVLAERVKYVPARDLINWLASADRLGYKSDDILDDEDECVVPNEISKVAPEVEKLNDLSGNNQRNDLIKQTEDNITAEDQKRNKAAVARMHSSDLGLEQQRQENNRQGAQPVREQQSKDQRQQPVSIWSLQQPLSYQPLQQPISSQPLQQPMQNQTRQSPMLNQSRQSPMLNQSRQSPMLNQLTQSPMLNQSTQSPMLNQSRQSPMLNQSTQSPVLSHSMQQPLPGQSIQHVLPSQPIQHVLPSQHMQQTFLSQPIQRTLLSQPIQQQMFIQPVQQQLLSQQVQQPVLNQSSQQPHLPASMPESVNLSKVSSPGIPEKAKLTCPRCCLILPTLEAYYSHVREKACQPAPSRYNRIFFCLNCKAEFTQKSHFDYHTNTKACWNKTTPNNFPGNVTHESLPAAVSFPSQNFNPSYSQPVQNNRENMPNNHRPLPLKPPNPTKSTQHTNAFHSLQSQSSISSPVHISPYPPRINRPGSALQKELKDIDEVLKKEIAIIPGHLSQDERIAKISSLMNAAATKKINKQRSYGVYPHSPQGTEVTSVITYGVSNIQETPPLINTYIGSTSQSPIDRNSMGPPRPYTALSTESASNQNYGHDTNPGPENSNSFQSIPLESSNYDEERTKNLKRPRTENEVPNPRPAGPNQNLNQQYHLYHPNTHLIQNQNHHNNSIKNANRKNNVGNTRSAESGRSPASHQTQSSPTMPESDVGHVEKST